MPGEDRNGRALGLCVNRFALGVPKPHPAKPALGLATPVACGHTDSEHGNRRYLDPKSMAEPTAIYLFRSEAIAPGSSTTVCAAPTHLVATAYGGGGHLDHEGVQRAFGGYAFYRNDETKDTFLAVWGARNASRFRTALRRKGPITIMRKPPPARLAWLSREGQRPPTSQQQGIG